MDTKWNSTFSPCLTFSLATSRVTHQWLSMCTHTHTNTNVINAHTHTEIKKSFFSFPLFSIKMCVDLSLEKWKRSESGGQTFSLSWPLRDWHEWAFFYREDIYIFFLSTLRKKNGDVKNVYKKSFFFSASLLSLPGKSGDRHYHAISRTDQMGTLVENGFHFAHPHAIR